MSASLKLSLAKQFSVTDLLISDVMYATSEPISTGGATVTYALDLAPKIVNCS